MLYLSPRREKQIPESVTPRARKGGEGLHVEKRRRQHGRRDEQRVQRGVVVAVGLGGRHAPMHARTRNLVWMAKRMEHQADFGLACAESIGVIVRGEFKTIVQKRFRRIGGYRDFSSHLHDLFHSLFPRFLLHPRHALQQIAQGAVNLEQVLQKGAVGRAHLKNVQKYGRGKARRTRATTEKAD